jgi:hypothetical protein
MKNVCFIIVLGFSIFQIKTLFAQDFNLKYYSSVLDGDYRSNYSGVASATYVKSSDVQKIKNNAASMDGARSIDKLTNNNSWLAWKALGEWDYKPGETYVIICAESIWSSSAVILIATISKDGESFDWWGWAISK